MAMGSVATNKYAEGYSGKRYYGGCTNVDTIETLAIERVKKVFGAEYANVQPHSGANANLAVQFAILKPGDTLLGMGLDTGGHLTHGSPVNISGTYFNAVHYGVNDEGFIDYDEVERIARECKPKMICAGAALVIAGLAADGFTTVDDIVYILRGYEDFDGKLRSLGGCIELVNSEEEALKFRLKVG